MIQDVLTRNYLYEDCVSIKNYGVGYCLAKYTSVGITDKTGLFSITPYIGGIANSYTISSATTQDSLSLLFDGNITDQQLSVIPANFIKNMSINADLNVFSITCDGYDSSSPGNYYVLGLSYGIVSQLALNSKFGTVNNSATFDVVKLTPNPISGVKFYEYCYNGSTFSNAYLSDFQPDIECSGCDQSNLLNAFSIGALVILWRWA